MQNGPTIEAKYANYFQIGQNSREFIIDFGQFYEGETAPLLHTRIITTPFYAKTLLNLLQEALAEHESQYEPSRDL